MPCHGLRRGTTVRVVGEMYPIAILAHPRPGTRRGQRSAARSLEARYSSHDEYVERRDYGAARGPRSELDAPSAALACPPGTTCRPKLKQRTASQRSPLTSPGANHMAPTNTRRR